MKKIIIIVFIVLIGLSIWFGFSPNKNNISTEIKNFSDCEKAGYPILESYPRQCITADKKRFTENLNEKELNTDPVIISPDISKPIGSPLLLSGEARGFWFFEGSFPVKLIDEKGQTIATGTAKAKSNWLTENFVPFEVKLTFKEPSTTNGQIILSKDSPSGLAENNRSIKIPVIFQGRYEIKLSGSKATDTESLASSSSTTD